MKKFLTVTMIVMMAFPSMAKAQGETSVSCQAHVQYGKDMRDYSARIKEMLQSCQDQHTTESGLRLELSKEVKELQERLAQAEEYQRKTEAEKMQLEFQVMSHPAEVGAAQTKAILVTIGVILIVDAIFLLAIMTSP